MSEQPRNGKLSKGCQKFRSIEIPESTSETTNGGRSSEYRPRIIPNTSTKTKIESVASQKVSRSTQTPRQNTYCNRNLKYFRIRREIKKVISESVITSNIDNRPYAEVLINGIPYHGLLDSGASISVLGAGAEEFLEKNHFKIHYLTSLLSTASGENQRIIGHVLANISYKNKSKLMRLHIAPNLKQPLYLGIDFWEMFGLVPLMVDQLDINYLKPSLESNPNSQDLNKEQQTILGKVIEEFPSFEKNGLGKTNVLSHKIDVGGAVPVKQRYFSVSPKIQEDIYKELDRMLSLGVIEESTSSWSSPLTRVLRANGKVRLCLDARRVNAVTVKDAYPLPLIEGLLGRLDKTRFITSIDLKDAYWQIPLDPASRDKTAFTVPGRPLYQFTVMPFGLCNAAQTMCRLMHKVIPHHLHDRVFVYLDDLLVVSASFEEHVSLLSEVARRLKSANLTINVEKSKFVLRETKYLGYVIGEGCLRVDPEKVRAIDEYPVPKNIKAVRRFLGMTGWYRRFISNYSSITAPITDLLKKGSKEKWNLQAQSSFEELKRALVTAPVLVNPDFSKHFYIQCDASTTGIGSVLFQRWDNGEEHPIAFMSHKLNKAQRNYSITELECLAVVMSVKRFRPYVEGYTFTVITDHSSLRWLMDQRDLSGRLARWSIQLQAFDFKIEYRKGSLNVVPDSLSRDIETIENKDDGILHINLDSEAFKDPEYIVRVTALKENPNVVTNFKVIDDKIYMNPGKDMDSDLPEWKLVVPESMTNKLIESAHNPPTAAHQGMAKTIEILQRYYYWPSMISQVRKFVNGCEICKCSKAVNYVTRPEMGKAFQVLRPWQRLYMDFLGPYPRTKNGFTHIFIILDHYSRFPLLFPIRSASAIKITNILEDKVFHLFGVPEAILTDNGVQFDSHLFKDLMNKYGIRHDFTAKYSPQANASERVNRTVLAAVRAYIKDEHQMWDAHLDEIAGALRNVIHSSTKHSPHFLVFGQHKIQHGSTYELLRKLEILNENQVLVENNADRLSAAQKIVLTHLQKAHEQNTYTYNLRARHREFVSGQEVFVRNFVQSNAANKFSGKLAFKFVPAIILRKIGNVSYEVCNKAGKTMGIYHTKDIR